MKKIIRIILIFVITASILWLYVLYSPSGSSPIYPNNFTPLRNDNLAEKYVPSIICDDKYTQIEKILYRAAVSSEGFTYIAYHPVWKFEKNTSRGILPFLSRAFYTGGLSFQKIMFGKGDVENVVIKITKAGKPVEIIYETADNYFEKNFSVKHKKITKQITEGKIPELEVMSWNHLFRETGTFAAGQFKPDYFSDKLWEEYEMTKNPPTKIKKHRAHEDWEIPIIKK